MLILVPGCHFGGFSRRMTVAILTSRTVAAGLGRGVQDPLCATFGT
jgi:hypothetical protein